MAIWLKKVFHEIMLSQTVGQSYAHEHICTSTFIHVHISKCLEDGTYVS